MPQFSTKLLNNIKTDLQQSKSFHRLVNGQTQAYSVVNSIVALQKILLLDYTVAVHI